MQVLVSRTNPRANKLTVFCCDFSRNYVRQYILERVHACVRTSVNVCHIYLSQSHAAQCHAVLFYLILFQQFTYNR
jgi:hypothetical protein